MNLTEITLSEDASILDALNKLSKLRGVSRLILFVINGKRQVIGSLTDGDIRRALIKHQDMNMAVKYIANKNFRFEKDSNDYQTYKPYLSKNIRILPILNNNKELVEIVDLSKQTASLPLECMIMAGGRGKRLSPLTDNIPKPLLPLGGKPIIEYNIDRLISFGIKKFYISLKYLGQQIKDYFGDGSNKGISIEYVWEDEPLGTAGALSLVKHFSTRNILLMNSDLFTDIDFEDLYLNLIQQKADMAVASTEYKVNIPYAVFETNNHVVNQFKEKPSYVYHSNAGIYIFKKELINEIPENKYYDITDLMENLIKQGGKLVHNPIIGYWIDIGKPVDYKQAQEFVKHLNS